MTDLKVADDECFAWWKCFKVRMKGLLLFSQSSDLLFIDADEEFLESAYKNEETEGDYKDDKQNNMSDPYNAGLMFVPFSASQNIMNHELKNPYSKIVCENGSITVFKQLDDILFVAVNGDGTEDEQFLNKKILIFHRILKFLYGPVLKHVKPSRLQERKERQNYLSKLLKTWCFLVQEEHTFLMEAIEQLQANYVVNEKSLKLLEMVLKKVSSISSISNNHALLLVHGKLLSLYSSHSAYELQSADILIIILLATAQFPSNSQLAEYLKPPPELQGEDGHPLSETLPSMNIENINKSTFTTESNVDSTDDERVSQSGTSVDTCPTPNLNRLAPQLSHHKEIGSGNSTEDLSDASTGGDQPSLSIRKITQEHRYKGSSTDDVTERNEPQNITQNIKHSTSERNVESDSCDSPRPTRQATTREASSQPKNKASSPKNEYQRHSLKPIPVCLHTPTCLYTPHQLYCIEIFPGIILAVVSEQPSSNQSGLICQLHDLLNDIVSGSSRGERLVRGDRQYTFDVLDMLVKKVTSSRCGFKIILRNIKQSWENAKSGGLDTALEQSQTKDLSDKILNSLAVICDNLKDLFLGMFIQKKVAQQEIHEVLHNCTQRIYKELADYKDYLIVKAQRNITITSYFQQFPGIVYFIFVDRTTNQVIVPALNVSPDDSEEAMKATLFLKRKIWRTARLMQQKLSQGYTTVLLRDGDFFISYYLWFEDNAHNPLVVQQPYKTLTNSPPPGILCGNLYRQLIRQCFPSAIPGSVHCFELICIHIGIVPTNVISVHIQQLSSRLWEMAGDGLASISLL